MFKGFSPEACHFLRQVEDKNSRQWYHENKDKYVKYIRDPYYELIAELTPFFLSVDREIMLEPNRCMSRIYRDTRFSKSKLLYRSSTWITFKRPSEDTLSEPCFYFEFTDRTCDCGMGYWAAKASSMAAYRKAIADDPKAFLKAVRPIEKDKDLAIRSSTYKRMPSGCPDIPGIGKWYQMKNILISTGNVSPEIAFRADLVDFLKEKFRAAAPLYKELIRIEAQRSDAATTEMKQIIRQEFEW